VDVYSAAMRIEALFADRGVGILNEAGVAESWEALLFQVPEDYLEIEESDPTSEGETLLTQVREYYSQNGDFRVAIAMTRGLLRFRMHQYGETDGWTLEEVGALGALADRAGRLAEAAELFEKAYTGMKAGGVNDLRFAIVAANFGIHMLRKRQPMQGEKLLEEAWRVRKAVAPETTGLLSGQLGELLIRRQRLNEAVPFLQESWERYRDMYGGDDERAVSRARTLAAVLGQLDREPEAVPVLRVLYEDAVRANDLERRATVALQLGHALEVLGYRDEAYRLVEESLKWTRAAGDPHPELPHRLTVWSKMQSRRGRPHEAEGLLREAVEAERRVHGEKSAELGVRYSNLGHLLGQLGRHDEAVGWLEAATKLLRSTLGDEHWQTKTAVEALATHLCLIAEQAIDRSDYPYARDLLFQARQFAAKVLGPKHAVTQRVDSYGY
jgi:tetratricopeptide (TPR) repeat protein